MTAATRDLHFLGGTGGAFSLTREAGIWFLAHVVICTFSRFHFGAGRERGILGSRPSRDSIPPTPPKRRPQQRHSVKAEPTSQDPVCRIPGAMNVPLEELKTRLAELPKTQKIFACCHRRCCLLSFCPSSTVFTLRAKCFKIRRLEGGSRSGPRPD